MPSGERKGVAKQCGDVVIVEDDAAVREFLSEALEQAGFATSSFATAEEARRAIEERRPAVLLSDVRLPGVSGYELCRAMKDAYGDEIAVVLVSGERVEPFDRAAGILLGADDYLVKPIDPEELVARVWRLAGRPSRRRSERERAATDGKLAALTDREREVLTLLANGSSQNDIAGALYISPKTVATHIHRILAKLEVRSRTQAVALALRNDRDGAHGLAVDAAAEDSLRGRLGDDPLPSTEGTADEGREHE
jgi:DNA-binding NarL/FixJ family response regulator